jgi:hypothetical protein
MYKLMIETSNKARITTSPVARFSGSEVPRRESNKEAQPKFESRRQGKELGHENTGFGLSEGPRRAVG